MEITNQKIQIENSSYTLYIKREDLIHPTISGNKYRKLKYNIIQAQLEKKETLLSFGGVFSNHILAVAAAGATFGFKTIGIIRGEELKDKISENPTLQKAQDLGMVFEFVTRDAYRSKNEKKFIEQLKEKFGDFYLLPEGGTNELAIKGCEEILTPQDQCFDYVCCAIGTGGTISGIINSCNKNQQILGFPALKGDFLPTEIRKFTAKNNWQIFPDYHFGGYGKVTQELVIFINDFYRKYHVPLDPIYTGKMVFGIFDLIEKKWFPNNSKILLIHTGGLQGIDGMNNLLMKKKSNELLLHD